MHDGRLVRFLHVLLKFPMCQRTELLRVYRPSVERVRVVEFWTSLYL